MAFTPKVWHDRPDLSTPITAASLEDLETRLAAYSDAKLGPSVYHLKPSGDTTGTTDDRNFNAAVNSLPDGGEIVLQGNSSTPFYTAAGWTLPAQTVSGQSGGGPVCLRGAGMPIIKPVGGSVTALSCHRTATYGNPELAPYLLPPSTIRDIVIDGTNATSASRGISVGDGMGYRVENVVIKNFTGAGARGALFTNTNFGGNHFFCEKSRFQVFVINCTDCVYITGGTGSQSWEYNMFDLMIIAKDNQRGVVIDNASLGGAFVSIMGNFPKTDGATTPVAVSGPNTGKTIAMLSFINTGRIWNDGQLIAKVERDAGGALSGSYPYTIYCDGSTGAGVQNSSGQITTGMTGIIMNHAEFSFSGMIGPGDYTGDLDDMYPPMPGAASWTGNSPNAGPTSGVAWVNGGPDAWVRVTGGTGVSILLNGIDVGGTGNQFLVPANGSMKITHSGAPTVVVIPIRVGN